MTKVKKALETFCVLTKQDDENSPMFVSSMLIRNGDFTWHTASMKNFSSLKEGKQLEGLKHIAEGGAYEFSIECY
jgi:hypothetical protein